MTRLQKSKSIRNLKISAPLSPLPPLPNDTAQDYPLAYLLQLNTTQDSLTFESYNRMTGPRSIPDSPVILITKFDFKAENRHELSVGVGEAVKLLERKGNGWILVKPIGRISDAGLIPASYVRIVRLNREKSNSKSDEKWLSQPDPLTHSSTKPTQQERVKSQDAQTVEKLERAVYPTGPSSTSSSMSSSPRERDGKYSSVDTSTSDSSSSGRSTRDQTFFSIQSSNASSYEPLTPPSSEEAYPVSGLVRNANSYNGRYWYRVDITMSDGKKRYLCRYYQDFYKLHCSLVDQLITSKKKHEQEQVLIDQLPQLPDPIPRPDLQTLSTIVLQRCQSLNVYIFKIVQNKTQLNYGNVLDEWAKPRLGDLELNEETQLSNDSIEELLKPIDSTMRSNTTSKATTSKPQLTIQTAVTPPLPAPQAPSYFHPSARSGSVSSLSSIPSTLASPKVWSSPTITQSPQFRVDRHTSTPTIPEGKELQQDDWLSAPTEPLFVDKTKNAIGRQRNQSCSSVTTEEDIANSCVKMKVYFQSDIFALKFKKNTGITEVKESIAKRLECEADALRLYYKNPVKNYFSPLVDDTDIDSAFERWKVSVKVHIWDNKI